MKTFRKWPATMDAWQSMFTEYPKMAGEAFNALFVVDGQPAKPLVKRMVPIVRKHGFLSLAKEMKKAVDAL